MLCHLVVCANHRSELMSIGGFHFIENCGYDEGRMTASEVFASGGNYKIYVACNGNSCKFLQILTKVNFFKISPFRQFLR